MKMKHTEDLTGQRFGKLVVVKKSAEDKHGMYKWHCKCDCGNEVTESPYRLKNGTIKSCGCLRNEHALMMSKKRTEIGSDEGYRLKTYIRSMLLEFGNTVVSSKLIRRYGKEGLETLIKLKWDLDVIVYRGEFGSWLVKIKKVKKNEAV